MILIVKILNLKLTFSKLKVKLKAKTDLLLVSGSCLASAAHARAGDAERDAEGDRHEVPELRKARPQVVGVRRTT
jgi:hypothetical protein